MKASPPLLSKTDLFQTRAQTFLSLGFITLLFFFSLLLEYQKYKALTQFDDYITTAWIEKQYLKDEHWVLKLQSTEGFFFYTTSKEDLKNLEGNFVKVRLFTHQLTFLTFLKGFYSHSVLLARVDQIQNRYEWMQELEKIHNSQSAPLFKALFFAGPIPKSLRDTLSAWGINHLLAISGFHLGVLSLFLFFILKSIYRPIQGKFFPYRHGNREIALVVFIVLFAYLYFLDFTPSLLRAFTMTVFTYILYDRGIKILSFSSLLLVVVLLISLWPKLLFALGFWFSVAGVFFIFLFLHHMQDVKAWQKFLLLHIWVYLSMLPLVHYFYGTFSYYQLFSPLLTMLFILFYPLELLIHLIGEGALFDGVLEKLLNVRMNVVGIFFPLGGLLIYLSFAFLAVFNKRFFYLLGFFALAFLGYLLYRMAEF